MSSKPFGQFLSIPPRNGLTKPKKVRGHGFKMVNMGELFKYSRIKNIPMDRVPLTPKEQASSLLESGDLLFARQSLVRDGAGKCSIFLGDSEPVCFESHIIRCRLDKSAHNPLFYYYYFSSPEGKVLMDTIIEQGAGAAGIRGSDLVNLNVPEFTLSFQNYVALILDTIDKKIQLNHQINQTLEQMAQAIFKSWFVDFEPVKAKIAALEAGGSEEDALLAAMQAISGKGEEELTRLQAEQPEQYAELRATAELFPSAMQDSELGEIPVGWKAGMLSDIAGLSNCRVSTDELTLETYVSTENMLENKKGIVTAVSLPPSASVPSFEPGEILISNIRPYFKKIWLATFEGGRSPDVLGFRSRHPGTSEYLFNFLYRDEFFGYMMLTSKGAKMPRGDKEAIMQYADVIPPVDLMQSFSERVRPFYILATSHNRETKSLTAVRETLLPKLLSGELSVPQALEQLTDVAEAINS